jgi:hypothetical protein
VSNAGGFEEKLTVKMAAARRASGVIRNGEGKPVSGAQVRVAKVVADKPAAAGAGAAVQIQIAQQAELQGIIGRRTDLNQIAMLETGTDGKWKVDSLPEANEEKIEVTVSHPDYRELRDTDGKPIAKTTVFLQSPYDPLMKRAVLQIPEVKTDEDGNFEFKVRMVGNCQAIALPKNRPPVLHKFVLGDDTPALALTPPAGRKLTGQVLDTSRKPVPGVPILFTGWQTIAVSENPVVATTDDDGQWTWENAPPDPVRGTAMLPSGRLWYWQEQGNKPVEIKIPLVERE